MSGPGTPQPWRVLLADDHAVVRAGYRHLLERHGKVSVVAEADHADEAYRLYREHRPDLFITDITMLGASGLDAIRRVLLIEPSARVLVFSMHVSPDFALAALRSGAWGYVTKNSTPDVLLRAIGDVMGGRQVLSPDIAQALALASVCGGRSPLEELTPREFDVLLLMVDLHSVERIAQALHLSTKTVQNLHYQIKRKLQVSNDIELAQLAMSCGLGNAPARPSP